MGMLLIILLLVLAFGGFGHTGYQRGWYGGYRGADVPRSGSWFGGGLGLVLLIIVLFLLFGGPHYYNRPY
jgi:hypothetical protein